MKNFDDVGKVISILSNQIKRQFDNEESQMSLTGSQGRILHYILLESICRDLFQKDIEDEFNLRRSTATGILQLMEKNNLIYRENVAHDARLKRIVVTPVGLQMKNRAMESIRVLEKKIKKNISDKDLETFFKVMKQMSKNLE